jgi:Cof subfamily protein (haloacid dehalogenase superfamily)
MTQIKKKQIRLVAIDLDGTLLDPQSQVTERTEKALRAVLAKGISVIFATGKTYAAVAPLVERFGIKTPCICVQGLVVYGGDGRIIHQQTLSPAAARQVITYAEDRGFFALLYSGARILMKMRNQQVESTLFTRYHEPAPETVGALQNVLESVPVNKIALVGEPRAIKALRWQLNAQVGSAVRLMQAGVPQMLEVLPSGASKGAALKALLKELKVDPEEVLAIGDAENDLEMLQLAGIGVAMGQAEQRVKDAADFVVASNAEDGAAEALEQFVLGVEPQAAELDESAAESDTTREPSA